MKTPTRASDVDRFDKWGSTYESSWLQNVLFIRVHQATLDLVQGIINRPPSSILDVGCGTGRLLRRAATYWPEAQLFGVDPANGMLEVARRLTPSATLLEGEAEALPLPDASIDLAFSTISFHHWRDQEAGVREIARVLRPEGYFVLADFSYPGWLTPVFVRCAFTARRSSAGSSHAPGCMSRRNARWPGTPGLLRLDRRRRDASYATGRDRRRGKARRQEYYQSLYMPRRSPKV